MDPALIDDAFVGCAMPEAEQGMNVARFSVLLADLPKTVPGVTVNRFCSSGLQTIAMAAEIEDGDAMQDVDTEAPTEVDKMDEVVVEEKSDRAEATLKMRRRVAHVEQDEHERVDRDHRAEADPGSFAGEHPVEFAPSDANELHHGLLTSK